MYLQSHTVSSNAYNLLAHAHLFWRHAALPPLRLSLHVHDGYGLRIHNKPTPRICVPCGHVIDLVGVDMSRNKAYRCTGAEEVCGLEAFDLCIISNVLNYLQDDASCDKLCALLLGGRTKAILLNERGALQGMADKVVRLDVGRNKGGYCRLARTTTKAVLILLWSFVAATRNGLSSERFLRTQERRGIRVLRLLTQEGAGRVASPRRSNLAGAQGAGCQGQEFLAHPPPAVASRTRAHNVIVPMTSCQTRTFDDQILTTADHSHVPGLQA